jgi:hypothetical protein
MIINLLKCILKHCDAEISKRNDLRWNRKGWFMTTPRIPEKGSLNVRTYFLPASPVDCKLYMDGQLVYMHTYFGPGGEIDKVKFTMPDGNRWAWKEGKIEEGVGRRNKHPATIEVTRPNGSVFSGPFVWGGSPVGTEGLELSNEYRAARHLMVVDLKDEAPWVKIGKRGLGGDNIDGPNLRGRRGDWVRVYVGAPKPA